MRHRSRILRVLLVTLIAILLLPGATSAGINPSYSLALPWVQRQMPPPVIQPWQTIWRDVFYVTWIETPRLAVSYELQQARNSSFTIGVITYTTTAQSYEIWTPPNGSYFYRVRGYTPDGGYSAWSNVMPLRLLLCESLDIPIEQLNYGFYNMDIINAPEAWRCTNYGSGQVIAVIDTGVDSDHPDLQGNLVAGATFVDGTSSWEDDNGHGSHVAGIAAGAINNLDVHGFTYGAAPKTNIMPVKVLDATGSGFTSDIAAGIIWATDHGADVINLSLGGFGANATRYNAIRYAYEHDVVIITSAGNCGEAEFDPEYCPSPNAVSYPAVYTETLAVAATNELDQRA